LDLVSSSGAAAFAQVSKLAREVPTEVSDGRARAAYRERLRDIDSELQEAELFNDLGRIDRLATERDSVVRELSRAYGIGGRLRPTGPSERARINVRNNISNALRVIKSRFPELWRHLSVSIRTGTYCSYTPEEPVRWKIDVATCARDPE
jgi:hypothetical protein